jgi:hypothetical protein
MTAWGRAAERDLEAYAWETALASPIDLTDRVMAAIESESPSDGRRSFPMMAALRAGRLRMAWGLVAVLVAMLGGAALVGGASAIIGRDIGAPNAGSPHGRPMLVADPTATATQGADDPTPEPIDAAVPPKPLEHDAVEATEAPKAHDATDDPEASDEADGTDEPEATDDGDDDDEADVDEPDSTDEPGETDASEDDGEGGEPQEPDGSSAS